MQDIPNDPPAICVQKDTETEEEKNWRELLCGKEKPVAQTNSGGGGDSNPPRPK